MKIGNLVLAALFLFPCLLAAQPLPDGVEITLEARNLTAGGVENTYILLSFRNKTEKPISVHTSTADAARWLKAGNAAGKPIPFSDWLSAAHVKSFYVGTFIIPPKGERVFLYQLGELFKVKDVKTCTVTCAQPGLKDLASVKVTNVVVSK